VLHSPAWPDTSARDVRPWARLARRRGAAV